MTARTLASSILVFAVLSSATPSLAARSWKIRFHPKSRSVQHFAASTELKMRGDLGLLGSIGGHLNLRLELRQRVAERRRRGPTTLELTYDRIQLEFELGQRALSYDSADPGQGGDAAVRDYLGRMVGQVVTLVVSRQGEVLDAHGLEGLWDDVADDSAERGASAETLTRGLGMELLKALYQQASPVYPDKRVRAGDTWTAELTIPDPAFGAMRIDSDYEVLEGGKLGRHKHVKTGVRNRIELEGRGPLLDQVSELTGTEGEVRITTERAEGSGTIWTERKTGVTLGLLAEQQMDLRLSVPMKVLGFTKRVTVPVILEQKIAFERME